MFYTRSGHYSVYRLYVQIFVLMYIQCSWSVNILFYNSWCGMFPRSWCVPKVVVSRVPRVVVCSISRGVVCSLSRGVVCSTNRVVFNKLYCFSQVVVCYKSCGVFHKS